MTNSALPANVSSLLENNDLEKLIAFALECGIRAPSTHNTQPWRFRIDGDRVNVYLDRSRRLPEADPRGRDMHMSIGCLLKNIETAAKYTGILREVLIKPEGDKIATITFQAGGARNEAYRRIIDAIFERYDARGGLLPLTAPARAAIFATTPQGHANAIFIDDKEVLADVAGLVKEGIAAFHANPGFRREFSSWMRGNLSGKQDGIHGYSIHANAVMSYLIPLILARADLSRKLGELNASEIRESTLAAVIVAKHDDPVEWVESGMLIEELALTAFANDAAAAFYAAPIEYDRSRARLKEILGTDLLPQFLVTFGVPKRPLPTTPRIPVAQRMLSLG